MVNKKIVPFISTLFLTACSSNVGLLDIDKYKNVDIKNIIKIDVSWDINDAYPLMFSITNERNIKTICDSLADSKTFCKKKKCEYDGGHSSMTLIDNNSIESRIPLSNIDDGNSTYYYTSTYILDYIYIIGCEQGVLS